MHLYASLNVFVLHPLCVGDFGGKKRIIKDGNFNFGKRKQSIYFFPRALCVGMGGLWGPACLLHVQHESVENKPPTRVFGNHG